MHINTNILLNHNSTRPVILTLQFEITMLLCYYIIFRIVSLIENIVYCLFTLCLLKYVNDNHFMFINYTYFAVSCKRSNKYI